MMTDELKIPEQTYNLLIDAKSCDDPVVVEAETLEHVRAVLEPAVEQSTGLASTDSLTVRQLAEQMAADDDAVEALAQNPETGDDPADDDVTADTDPDTDSDVTETLANLEQEDAHEVRQQLAKAQTLENRLPEHAESLKRAASETLDCDESEIDALLDDIPADPRLV